MLRSSIALAKRLPCKPQGRQASDHISSRSDILARIVPAGDLSKVQRGFHEGMMTTIRQLIQTSPAKANELLTKLADTSDTAVKTRDRLFSELKVELQLLARLEEQHLFPILKKHRGTKKLALEAINDNRQTRKLLTALERTPKDSEEFAVKVADLRKVFQQHVRDEKNELLPAILEALSDEEAEAIVVKIEDKKAEIEMSRRAETEERRAEARREREAAEAEEQVAEGIAAAARAGAESAQQLASTTQDAVQNALGTTTDMAHRSMGQLMGIFGLAGQQSQRPSATPPATFDAATPSVLFRGLQDISREWLEMSRARFQTNLDSFNAMTRCRSVQDFVAVQSSLVRDNVELTIQNSRRIAELSTGMINATANPRMEEKSGTGARGRKRAA